jgi:hypothetical protein
MSWFISTRLCVSKPGRTGTYDIDHGGYRFQVHLNSDSSRLYIHLNAGIGLQVYNAETEKMN